MTCWFNPHGTTMDVYDHEGNLVAEDTPIAYDWDGNPIGSWNGEYPNRVLGILYNAREGSQPSAYNQELLFCLAAEQIEQGTPPA